MRAILGVLLAIMSLTLISEVTAECGRDAVIRTDGSQIEGHLECVPPIRYPFGTVTFCPEEVSCITFENNKMLILTRNGQLFSGAVPDEAIPFTKITLKEEFVEIESDDCVETMWEISEIEEPVDLFGHSVYQIVVDSRSKAPPLEHPWFHSLVLRNGDTFPVVVDSQVICVSRDGGPGEIPVDQVAQLRYANGGVYGYLKTEAVPRKQLFVRLRDTALAVRLAKDGQPFCIPWSMIDRIMADNGCSMRDSCYPCPQAKPEDMVLVAAGRFHLGGAASVCDLARNPLGMLCRWDQRGNLDNSLRLPMPSFYIDRYEVTNADYYRFVRATGYAPPAHWIQGKPLAGSDRYPVVNVTYHDAAAYAKWAGKRLPTEIEWERAAKGNSCDVYPYGMNYSSVLANTESEGPQPVGSYSAIVKKARVHPYSLAREIFDMSGNVAEWTASVYDPAGYDITVGDDGWYNPHLSRTDGEFRVVRGGSFRSSAMTATSIHRDSLHEDDCNAYTGFRCVADAQRGE